jgi:hypothetical protein
MLSVDDERARCRARAPAQAVAGQLLRSCDQNAFRGCRTTPESVRITELGLGWRRSSGTGVEMQNPTTLAAALTPDLASDGGCAER